MPTQAPAPSLVSSLLAAHYQTRQRTVVQTIEQCLATIDAYGDNAIWISRPPRADVLAAAQAAQARINAGQTQPLLGIPFAVKDNIDVAGMPTTAACPSFSYRPARHATVVQRLLDAGAILIGKTNLDQFATGLVGTRSPYGTPGNPFDHKFIPGGSSSGSAVAVSAGLVSFALGTDTAGSGRVPAAFNNIVGLKPSRGRLSNAGVVPACRSLDCVSVFSLTCRDAQIVAQCCAGFDPQDPYSRSAAELIRPGIGESFRFGVPAPELQKFFGDDASRAIYHRAFDRLTSLGGTPVQIDLAPFLEAGALLYDGPWVAERLAGLREFLSDEPDAVLPLTRGIVQSGRRFDAVAAFDGLHELKNLERLAQAQWQKMDLLLLPTAGTIYTLDQVQADNLHLNATLGYYTTFANLLDLAAVAAPAGFRPDGLPVGVSLLAPRGSEDALLHLADRLHRIAGVMLGATNQPLAICPAVDAPAQSGIGLAVVGAHLSGQPLNHQLTSVGAKLVRTCKTSPDYKLYALAGMVPPKPGLIRSAEPGGRAIALEVWEMTAESFGKFVAAIPPPLGIGTITLDDGQCVKGFLCEPHALRGAQDITEFGGWMSYLEGTRSGAG